ncbi:hypothetical protein [Xenorhabdus entomophaga]|uniref:hypothetical protein n=1 Tax=Xenorhabdus entomophaga TaxID=3136257 RepID=UPI0030F460F1
MEWIDIKKSTPPECENVVVYIVPEGEIRYGYFLHCCHDNPSFFDVYDDSEFDPTRVTHWFYAPSPKINKEITMPKHIHADLISEYARLSHITDRPWEYFQYRYADGNDWLEHENDFGFHPEIDFRLKPRTIKIGEYEVPEPVREPLKQGTRYYMPQVIDHYKEDEDLYEEDKWDNVAIDYRRLNKGLIHKDRESAELHAKALIALTSS